MMLFPNLELKKLYAFKQDLIEDTINGDPSISSSKSAAHYTKRKDIVYFVRSSFRAVHFT